jgi:hypothetical protein
MGEQRQRPDNSFGSRSDVDDRRKSPRIDLLGRLNGHLVTLQRDVTVREMSLGGLSIETPFEFPIGAVHVFRLTLGDGFSIELSGRVMHTHPDPVPVDRERHITGFRFLDEPPSIQPLISEFITRIIKSR